MAGTCKHWRSYRNRLSVITFARFLKMACALSLYHLAPSRVLTNSPGSSKIDSNVCNYINTLSLCFQDTTEERPFSFLVPSYIPMHQRPSHRLHPPCHIRMIPTLGTGSQSNPAFRTRPIRISSQTEGCPTW